MDSAKSYYRSLIIKVLHTLFDMYESNGFLMNQNLNNCKTGPVNQNIVGLRVSVLECDFRKSSTGWSVSELDLI